MAEQMRHLMELAMMPRISIQIIPSEVPHAGLLGAFVIAEPTSPRLSCTWTARWTGRSWSLPKAEAMDVVFRALQMEALTGSASLTKMKETAQRWKEQITP